MENGKSFIQFSHVTKKFGDFKALDDISLDIPKGCFTTLLGPSGCGKTTLMRQLAGFSEPDEGHIYVDGKLMNGLPPFRRNTPLVFQEYALFPHMTVYENISYGLRLRKMKKRRSMRKCSGCWRCSRFREWKNASRRSFPAGSSSAWLLPGR